MHANIATTAVVFALSASLASAHGKISVATGDAGGNTTALGIMGGAVPGAGPNRQTEVDTTIFRSRQAASDGLGRTKGNGDNTLDDVERVAAMSGTTLPQVSSNGGYISGTYHIVTTDGAGPLEAIVDPSGTGKFSQGTQAEVMTQVPGQRGNIAPGPLKNNLPQGGGGGLLGGLGIRGLSRRALNVNADYPLKIAIPAGTTCSGTMGGQSNVCLLKVANPSGAGPFGGVIAFQMAQGQGSNTTTAGKTGQVSPNQTEGSAGGNSADDQGSSEGGSQGTGESEASDDTQTTNEASRQKVGGNVGRVSEAKA